MVNRPDLDKARNYALDKLQHELSPDLTYHCLGHTRDEVVPAVDHLATLEGVTEADHLLLLTAAYFHDLGFIRQRKDHETISIQIAEETLPFFGYSDTDIAVVRGIIQATRLPQSPTNLLEKIMVDADLDDLGHESFWKRSDDLRQELENYGVHSSDEEWYTNQLLLMQTHSYYTDSERSLRNSTKQKHILELKRRLTEIKP